MSAAPIEPIVGRYVSFDIAGRRCRVYFEEAGQASPGLPAYRGRGRPAVSAHDERRGRDLALSRHRLRPALARQVYPPEGWQDEEYQLSTDLYVETVMAFCAALDLSRPALIGCSIGGRIALELAHRHSDRFRALIGVESADYQEPWYDTAWLHRPDVHGGEVCAALVSGLVAPQSPAVHRHETLWQYMQGGPGVFRGDLYFYRVDGDLRGRLGGIRTDICPLYLLTGEYDFSCSPEDTCAPRSPYREPRWRSCASWAISP